MMVSPPAVTWAHPRSRGEHPTIRPTTTRITGSSPLARGTQVKRALVNRASGLIPARAGNTISCPSPGYWRRAHPRSRGEHGIRGVSALEPPGSSPLARGTLASLKNRVLARGLIPARAGNTERRRFRDRRAWAHPRSRGEHVSLSQSAPERSGSSPLARGTHAHNLRLLSGGGLIPARAGNTRLFLLRGGNMRAHPRSRGEHRRSWPRLIASLGSSPLARGTLPERPAPRDSGGLIPARAGNTVRIMILRSRGRAHPRSRGEHLPAGQEALAREWLIPARAGNTHPPYQRIRRVRAHPRSRGEHECR